MLEPAGFKLLIKPFEVEKVSAGGIVLTSNAYQEKLEAAGRAEGIVHKVGRTAYRAYDDGTPWVTEGDHIIFSKYSGQFITDPNTEEEFIIIRDDDVIAIVREDETKEEVENDTAGC